MGMDVGGDKSLKSDINVVPLVDVCLVLLVIFMVVTPLLQKGVDVKLPEAVNAEKKPEVKITLAIKKDGTLFLESDQLTKRSLGSKIKDIFRSRTDKSMYLKADTTLTYQTVMDVMNICRDEGVESIALLTEKKASEK